MRSSGLIDSLHESGDLIPHEILSTAPHDPSTAVAVLRPELVPFISYPYEWSFGMLKDAALLTLRIQRLALERGMMLKDASAYNIQFLRGRPVLIDTLSFTKLPEGAAWPAYRQFCRHFLAPLALIARVDPGLGALSRIHLDGIPLETASRLLPWRSRLNIGLLTHLHLHAAGERRMAGSAAKECKQGMSRMGLMGIVESLEGTIAGLEWKVGGTAWAEYSGLESYEAVALEKKRAIVREWLERIRPQTMWDLGANRGNFSRLAPAATSLVVSWDIDPSAVEHNYRRVKSEREERILPLVADLTNPSPGLGWMHGERRSMIERGPADAALALALVHHLALGNNLPFSHIVDFFQRVARRFIVEFVPASDPQAAGLMAGREEIFPDYRVEVFKRYLEERFTIAASAPIEGSERTLFLLERR